MNPLYKKLGIRENSEIFVLNYNDNYLDLFNDFPSGVIVSESLDSDKVSFVHIFVTSLSGLQLYFDAILPKLTKDGMIWVSWPKKTSGVESKIYQPEIVQYGLNKGLVDVKVASVSEVWSAQKFVFRLKDR